MTLSHARPADWRALPFLLGVLATAGCNDATEAVRPVLPNDAQAVNIGHSVVTSIVGLEPLIDAASNLSEATDISDFGQVVGTSEAADANEHAVIWDNSVFPQDLGLLPAGTFSEAFAITPDGTVIVGHADDGGAQRAVRWVKLNGVWTIDALPTPENAIGCAAKDIARDRTIAGSCTVDGRAHVTVWQNGVATDLLAAVATGVNSTGQLAGYDAEYDLFVWNFRTDPLTSTPIDHLGGATAFTAGINESGTVVGSSQTGTPGQLHAFLWTPKKGTVDLGTLGGTSSSANGISDAGAIVGSADLPAGGRHAAYWDRGKVFDLGVLAGYTRSTATSINANGKIVGWSEIVTPAIGERRATLWTVK